MIQKKANVVYFKYYPNIYLKRLRETTYVMRNDNRSPSRESSPGPPEHEVVLTNREWRSVMRLSCIE